MSITTGLCDGVFDLLHYGHIKHLENCSKLCDFLIVLVASDDYAKTKGSGRPIINQDDRIYSVSSLKFVDLVIPSDGTTSLVNALKPDKYFKNYDYILDKTLSPEITVVRMPVYFSTTNLIKKIKGGH